MLMLAGCTASSNEPIRRSLPATATIIPQRVPLPERRADGDAVAALAEHRAAAAENGRRLESARRNYEALRRSYAGAE